MKEKIPEILRKRYQYIKQHSAYEQSEGTALEVVARDRIGLIADITSEVSRFKGDISYLQSWITFDGLVHLLVQMANIKEEDRIAESLKKIDGVLNVTLRETYSRTFGKRVIVVGGGAQVAQVAAGAIAEADRHNIRGETISVDTIAVVGEEEIASAVRAVGRLHRAAILVLAGALMGGDITQAVLELRHSYGIPVISLTMAGSVTKAADLVVSDPVEAGVMAVMAISHIGKFDLLKLSGKTF